MGKNLIHFGTCTPQTLQMQGGGQASCPGTQNKVNTDVAKSNEVASHEQCIIYSYEFLNLGRLFLCH